MIKKLFRMKSSVKKKSSRLNNLKCNDWSGIDLVTCIADTDRKDIRGNLNILIIIRIFLY